MIDVAGLDALIGALGADGRRVLGPVAADGAIGLAPITSVDDLPRGWGDDQAPGHYRLRPRDDGALFGYAVGPQGPRREFFEPRTDLVHIRRRGNEVDIEAAVADPGPPTAFVGLRGCELAAIAIQDRVLLGGAHPDPHYAARRADSIVVAVNCGDPAATCFCTSMGTGPRAEGEFDLRLTELIDGDRHEFLCEVGSDRGARLLASATSRPAGPADHEAAERSHTGAVAAMGRHLDLDGLAARLAASPDDPRWDDVAARCLSCTNCTLVCPTCFCSSVEDSTTLDGTGATRTRVWDSCFGADHSYLHGGSVHASTRSRYRQWLTHKLSTWDDQFGTAGCVGCGRCIAWCPAGIDITVEAAEVGR